MINNFDLNKKRKSVVDLRPNKAVKATLPASASVQKTYALSGFAKKSKQTKRSPLLGFLIFLLVILAVASIAGFFFFNQGFSSRSLKLTLKGPKNATAGEEIKFELDYENLDKTSLTNLQLVAEYPEGFYLTSSNVEPKGMEGSVWDLPDLPSKTSEKIILTGQIFGEAEKESEFNFIIRYQPANFSSDFKEEISKTVFIKDTNYPFSFNVPEKANDGDAVEYKFTLENKTKDDLPSLFLQLEPGDGFNVLEATPLINGLVWEIGPLEAKSKKDFIIKGEYDPALSPNHHWRVTWRQEIEENGVKRIKYLIKKEGDLEIVKPEASLKLELKDPSSLPVWGQNADFKISYANTGKIPLEKPVLALKPNGLVDWAKFAPAENTRVENGVLYWLPDEKNKFLQNISAGSTGEVEVSLPIIEQPADADSLSPEEMILRAVAEFSLKFNGHDKIFTSPEYSYPFSAEAGIKAEAKYNLDQTTKVGSGPVPPLIGQKTKYRIYWKVYSGSTVLKNVKLKATLPSYINWEQQADSPTFGSALAFNESGREVTWEIAELPSYAQGLASFDVSVTPSQEQVNQLLILSNPVNFSASLPDSGAVVAKTAGLLTSDLIGDAVNQGKGRVGFK